MYGAWVAVTVVPWGWPAVATLGVRWEGGCTHTWWVEFSTRVWGERGHHGLPQHERIFRVDASTEGAKQCMHVLGGVHIKLTLWVSI